MATTLKPKTGEFKRGFSFKREAIDEENRRVELAFSSEVPYRRHFGMEVLGHGKDEVDLSRLGDGTHPLLLNHDRNQQIGVVETAAIGKDGVGRSTVRFSKSALGEEIFQDVRDGIRSQASVAYEVNDWKINEKDNGEDEWRATNWQPFEVSIVSIAADTSVGVGRDKAKENTMNKEIETPPEKVEQQRQASPPPDYEKIKKEVSERARTEAAEGEKKRQRDIFKMGQDFGLGEVAQKAIDEGKESDVFRVEVLDHIKSGKGTKKAMAVLDPTIKDSRSIGEQFIASESYRSATKSKESYRSMNVELPFSRATLTSSGLTSIQKLPGITLLEQMPLTVESIIPSGTTSNTTIRYIKETSYTQAATKVAEEGLKPEASFALEEVDAGVKKIAVIGRVTEEMFQDYGEMEAYVNNRLTYMVQSKVDNDLLNGDGSSNVLRGLLNIAGIQTEAAPESASPVDAIMHAITKVRTIGFFEPDYIILHPNDWRDFQLSTDKNGQYLGGGPFTGSYGQGGFSAPTMFWGKPVVWTTAIAEGTALVGAFRMATQAWNKEGLRLDSTNSDASDFQYNRICLRAERRLALAVYRPLGLCTVTGIA